MRTHPSVCARNMCQKHDMSSLDCHRHILVDGPIHVPEDLERAEPPGQAGTGAREVDCIHNIPGPTPHRDAAFEKLVTRHPRSSTTPAHQSRSRTDIEFSSSVCSPSDLETKPFFSSPCRSLRDFYRHPYIIGEPALESKSTISAMHHAVMKY